MREYKMEDMKSTIGHNIVALRRSARMTQSELAERLNYSDKAVSKWECGDAVPDILTLTRLTELFGVTLDWLVKSKHQIDMPSPEHIANRRHNIIILLSAFFVWLVATAIFVMYDGFTAEIRIWLAFIAAIPTSALVVFVLANVWDKRVLKYISISIVVWGVILTAFLFLINFESPYFEKPWMLFFLGVPGQGIIIAWSHLFSGKHRRKKQDSNGSTNEEKDGDHV